jgi:hypothetical protein
MKKLLMIVSVLLLAGCLATPVKRNFPEVPEDLKNACPELRRVDPTTTKLSDVIMVVSNNYAQYHECQVTVDTWIKWYNMQKEIFESVK